jgi:hypothetical protein
MFVDRSENEGYVIQADQLWFGNHIPGHFGIGFIEGDILFHGATAHSEPRPHRCRDFTITLRHIALGSTPLDEWSARRRGHYVHNTQHSQKTDIRAPGGIRTRNPSKRAATGIGTIDGDANMNNGGGRKRMYPSTGLRTTCFSRGRKRIWFWSLRVTVDENWHPRKVRLYGMKIIEWIPSPVLPNFLAWRKP